MPAYICDNNRSLWGEKIAGVPIVSPEELKKETMENAKNVVIVMAQVLLFTMLESLQLTYEDGGLQKYYHLIMRSARLKHSCFIVKTTNV